MNIMDTYSLNLSLHSGEHRGAFAISHDNAAAGSPTTLGIHVAARYRICTQGVFDPNWLDLLSGFWVISSAPSSGKEITLFIGEVADQAALMGVLQQLYNLGFPLLLVEHLVDQEKQGALLM